MNKPITCTIYSECQDDAIRQEKGKLSSPDCYHTLKHSHMLQIKKRYPIFSLTSVTNSVA